MKLIRAAVFICGILFVAFTILPAVVAFLIPVLGVLGIVFVVVGCLWFVGRLVFKGGGS